MQRRVQDALTVLCRVYQSQTCGTVSFTPRIRRRNAIYAIGALGAEPALGHVDVTPRLVEQGKATQLRVELPQLRAGPRRSGWKSKATASPSSTAACRRLPARNTLERPSSCQPRCTPGELLLILRAVFADGESVEVDGAVTVVPPAPQGSEASDEFPWLGVAAGVTLALALAVAVLLLARRRRSAW